MAKKPRAVKKPPRFFRGKKFTPLKTVPDYLSGEHRHRDMYSEMIGLHEELKPLIDKYNASKQPQKLILQKQIQKKISERKVELWSHIIRNSPDLNLSIPQKEIIDLCLSIIIKDAKKSVRDKRRNKTVTKIINLVKKQHGATDEKFAAEKAIEILEGVPKKLSAVEQEVTPTITRFCRAHPDFFPGNENLFAGISTVIDVIILELEKTLEN